MAPHRRGDPAAARGARVGRKPGRLPAPKDSVKLGLKELIVRGAYRIAIEQGRWGSRKVTLLPQERPQLPSALRSFDARLRPWAPAEIKDVIGSAREANPRLTDDLRELFRADLSNRGLIASHRGKMLGLFPVPKWSRTASGDAWAATGAQHLHRLASLPVEVESDPHSAARLAAVAGALTLMEPAAMASVARLRRRGGSRGFHMGFVYHSGVDAGFDPFDALENLFDSVLEGSLDTLDAGIDAVDGALDSVASSIDSAVDSGVDAGGRDGGGGDGGGGDGGGG